MKVVELLLKGIFINKILATETPTETVTITKSTT